MQTQRWSAPDLPLLSVPLTYLSIGFWKKRAKGAERIHLLIAHSAAQFVLLVECPLTEKATPQALRQVLRRLTAHSPFQSRLARGNSFVAFEVRWSDIVGLDYSNPLCLPGRLVLETNAVCKLEFSCLEEAYAYYGALPPDWHTSARAANLFDTWEGEWPPPERPLSASVLQSLDLAGDTTGSGQKRSQTLWQRRFCSSTQPQPNGRLGGTAPYGREKEASLIDGSTPEAKLVVPRGTSADPVELRASTDVQPSTRSEACQATSRPSEHAEARGSDREGLVGDIPGQRLESCRFDYRSVTFNFDAPSVPIALRPAIQGNERLLKLYESGLPAWAIYGPQYGIWYRPWMRRVTFTLFILVSAFSLVVGFYDLYKNVPYLDQFLRQVVSSWLPSTAILRWLDENVSFRLSILLTYLFGKSELAVQLLRWLGGAGRLIKEALQPATALLGPPLALFAGMAKQSWGQLAAAGATLYGFASFAAKAVFGPPLTAVLQALLFVHELLKPALQVAAAFGASAVMGPWTALKLLLAWLSTSGRAAAHVLRISARAGAAVWQGLKTGTQIAPAVSSAAADVGSQAKTWYVLVPLEALEVVRNSTVKVVRALHTLARLCTQVARDVIRHRLTLGLRMQRSWAQAQTRAYNLVPAAWLGLRRQSPASQVPPLEGQLKGRSEDMHESLEEAEAHHMSPDIFKAAEGHLTSEELSQEHPPTDAEFLWATHDNVLSGIRQRRK